MKRFTLAIVFSLVGLATLVAQSSLPTLRPKDARTMGMGGSFVSLSSGYDSLYGNPAAFASSKGQLTLVDLSTWAYVKPTTDNINLLSSIMSMSTADQASTVNDFVVDNGFGGGFSTGLGYVGHGLAIGAYALGDLSASGTTALGATITSAASLNAVVGLGFPIKLGDAAVLRIGGDVRPFYRADSVDGGWMFSSLVSALATGGDITETLTSQSVNAGFGLAMDFGAQLQMGSLSLGIAARDVTPSFLTETQTVKTFLDNLSSGNLGSSSSGTESTISPALYVGLGWSPRFLPGFLDPNFYFELQDLLAISDSNESFWNAVHAGLDLKFLSFISLRAGINEGWLSAGVGVNLYLVEVNAAVFTEELGTHPGDEGRSGLSIQASIHL